MKFLFASLVICIGLFFSKLAFALSADISGVVTMAKDLEKILSPNGALYIIARSASASPQGSPPLAVVRVAQPKFPLKFTIGPSNSMMGVKFEGTMTITARYSVAGDALDKTGPEGTDPKNLKILPGKTDLKIDLKAKGTH